MRALAANVLRIEESLRGDDDADLVEVPASSWRELVAAAQPPAQRRMRVMPANSSGWFWHALARETGALGDCTPYVTAGQLGLFGGAL